MILENNIREKKMFQKLQLLHVTSEIIGNALNLQHLFWLFDTKKSLIPIANRKQNKKLELPLQFFSFKKKKTSDRAFLP
jgi:hypothetical protein